MIYLDSSALVKLVVEEDESRALTQAIGTTPQASSELVLAEVPRSVRRLVAGAGDMEARLMGVAQALLEDLHLVPVGEGLLRLAGHLDPPSLRALDAIHVAAALSVGEGLDAFVTYDRRQAEAAQAAGLPVEAPA